MPLADSRRGRSRHGEERCGHGASELSEANRSLAAVAETPGSRRGRFTNQRHWCQATTAWRATGNGRVRRAPEGLRGISAIDLSRGGLVLLALDHKQFPVRHLCETASVHLSSLVERRSRISSLENAEVELEHDQLERRSRIAWQSERLAAGAELTAQIRPTGKRSAGLGWCPLGLSEQQRPTACCPSRVRRSASTFVTAESAPASHPSSWQSATPSSSAPATERHRRRASRDWRRAGRPLTLVASLCRCKFARGSGSQG
jgi:hypothetical protein